jgi:hypothetical protein
LFAVWRWLVLGATALVLLVVPSAASAKQVTKILVVDSNGRSIDLGGGWSLYQQLRPIGAASPVPADGSYLLLYPVMERGIPMEPGRYFIASDIACWSWTLSMEGCASVGVPTLTARTRALAPFTLAPTTLRTLSHAGRRYTVPSNGTVAIELALLRTKLARHLPGARGCRWRLQARWQGPAASLRPTSLCLRIRGISAGRLLYPLTPGVLQMLRLVS